MKVVSQAQLVQYLLVVGVCSFVIDVMSGTFGQYRLLWISVGLLVIVTVFLAPHDGLLGRENSGRTRWARGLAFLLLMAYPVTVGLTANESGLIAALGPAFCLWLASTLLLWSSTDAGWAEVGILAASVGSSLASVILLYEQFQQLSLLNGLSLLLFSAAGFWTVVILLKGERKFKKPGVLYLIGLVLMVAGQAARGLRLGFNYWDPRIVPSHRPWITSAIITMIVAIWLVLIFRLLSKPRLLAMALVLLSFALGVLAILQSPALGDFAVTLQIVLSVAVLAAGVVILVQSNKSTVTEWLAGTRDWLNQKPRGSPDQSTANRDQSPL